MHVTLAMFVYPESKTVMCFSLRCVNKTVLGISYNVYVNVCMYT